MDFKLLSLVSTLTVHFMFVALSLTTLNPNASPYYVCMINILGNTLTEEKKKVASLNFFLSFL